MPIVNYVHCLNIENKPFVVILLSLRLINFRLDTNVTFKNIFSIVSSVMAASVKIYKFSTLSYLFK